MLGTPKNVAAVKTATPKNYNLHPTGLIIKKTNITKMLKIHDLSSVKNDEEDESHAPIFLIRCLAINQPLELYWFLIKPFSFF